MARLSWGPFPQDRPHLSAVRPAADAYRCVPLPEWMIWSSWAMQSTGGIMRLGT